MSVRAGGLQLLPGLRQEALRKIRQGLGNAHEASDPKTGGGQVQPVALFFYYACQSVDSKRR